MHIERDLETKPGQRFSFEGPSRPYEIVNPKFLYMPQGGVPTHLFHRLQSAAVIPETLSRSGNGATISRICSFKKKEKAGRHGTAHRACLPAFFLGRNESGTSERNRKKGDNPLKVMT